MTGKIGLSLSQMGRTNPVSRTRYFPAFLNKPELRHCAPNDKPEIRRLNRHLRTTGAVLTFGVLCSGAAVRAQNPAPPAPSAVPPNASRVTATVRAHKVWTPAELEKARPAVATGTTLWSLRLELLTATAAEPGLAPIAQAPSTLEAFSDHALPEQLVGKTISATLTLTGGTDGARWFLKDFTATP